VLFRSRLDRTAARVEWEDLILPAPLLKSLQYLAAHLQGYAQAEKLWGFQAQSAGVVALLIGAAGTGKTIAAQAIAHALQTPLFQVNLAQVNPEDYPQLLQDMTTQNPIVLLLEAAQLWLGRSGKLDSATLRQFLAHRHQQSALTLLSVPPSCVIPADGRSQIDQILAFPLPTEADRLQFWQCAFPPQVPIAADIDWQALAKQLALTGGEIGAIAQDAILYAAAIEAPQVSMAHLKHVLVQRGMVLRDIPLKLKGAESP